MPRTARAARGGEFYHVINRGNARSRVFFDDEDYSAFIDLMRKAKEKHKVGVVAWCLMPNHFHLVLTPSGDEDLAHWMHWLCTCHASRHHRRRGTTGHIWEGRFKAFPIQQDGHLLTVIRYVERNALRANLVERAEYWPWSSLAWRVDGNGLLEAPPVALPYEWTELVNEPQTEDELEALRRSSCRGTPFGDAQWRSSTATRMALGHTLRPRGRPPKTGTC